MDPTDGESVALSLGVVAGGVGSSTKAWTDAVRRVMNRVVELREGVHSPLNLNIVYQIPGEVFHPDFVGVRTGRWSSHEQLLMVQVALPTESTDDMDSRVILLAREAV